MAKQSNWSRGKSYTVNDKIGVSRAHTDGTEAPRSFLDNTGIRKYDKDDLSVHVMRKNRAKSYRNSIGIPGSGALALTAAEMARTKPASLQKSVRHKLQKNKKSKILSVDSNSYDRRMKTPYIQVPEVYNPYDEIRKKDEALAVAKVKRRLEKMQRKSARRELKNQM